MIHVNPRDIVHVATGPIDFRCGIDSLIGLVKSLLQEDPFSGHLFCFSNKASTAFKILVYDQQGFWLCHKRFSQGKIPWWPKFDGTHGQLDSKNFLLLLYGGNGEVLRFKQNWRNF